MRVGNDVDRKSKHSTEQRELISEILRHADVRLSGYCPECQERFAVGVAENRTIFSQEEVR